MSMKASNPRSLIIALLGLTLLVMVLGGAVLVVKLRPDSSAPSTQERSIATWEGAVADDPTSDIAQTGLGMALLDVGRIQEAETAFRAALALNDGNWMANFQLALLLRQEKPERTLVLFDKAAANATAENRAVVLLATGDFLMARGETKAAVGAYRGSIANASFIFDSHLGLAKALEDLGKTEAALAEYREAGRFAPGHPEVEAAIQRLEDDTGND
jgi:tetratricopeptide (TPR) repeat protein